MKAVTIGVLLTVGLLVPAANAGQKPAARIDEPAPAFTLTDYSGGSHSLEDYKGKLVVLEWVNFDCPFVKKHYKPNNMQTLQKKYADKGVVWLSINSSAKGKQGHFDPRTIKARIKKHNAVPTAYLVDADGTVGKRYGARTTPHMYVINKDGVLIYAGAIDDKPSTKVDDVEGATNYVAAALDAAQEGKPVTVKATQSYGCSVKY